jgi:hypothetical protein
VPLVFSCKRFAQRLPDLLPLGCHTLADRLTVHLEVSRLMILPTNVSETQKVKGLRLPLPSLGPPFRGIAPEFDQTRLLWMQLQPEFPHPLLQVRQELLGFFPVLKSWHRVVGVRTTILSPCATFFRHAITHRSSP